MPTPDEYAAMERARQNAMTQDVLAVDRALTDEERALFLSEVFNRMPRLTGAHVADVLDIFENSDAYLPITEPFWEAHGEELHRIRGAVYAVYAALVLQDGRPTIEKVRELAQRAGLPPREG